MPKKSARPPSARNTDAATDQEVEIPLRIVLTAPPAGVRFCLQRGADELVDPKVSTGGDDLSFDLTIRAKPLGGDAPPRLLGPFTQGPPAERYVYLRVGTMAGQHDSPWSRRIKVPLTTITWPLIRAALKAPRRRLEARVNGTAKDGGPACATVPLLAGGWQVAS